MVFNDASPAPSKVHADSRFGAVSGSRRGTRTQARVTSLGRSVLPRMSETLIVYPFRYRDPRTKRWVKARYKATQNEIAARHVDWELMGSGEERRPIGGYFDPGRRKGA